MRIDQEFHEQMSFLTLRVARDAWRRLRALIESGHRFDTYSTPVIDPHSAGAYPTVGYTNSVDKGASLRLASVFGRSPSYSTTVLYSDLDGAEEYEAFMTRWAPVTDFLSIGSNIRVDIFELPVDIAERVINTSGAGNAGILDEARLENVYQELSNFWINETLPVELLLPILGITFEDEEFELHDGCRVQRLSDGEQLARWPEQRRRELDDAARMATHALVVPGWEITVDKWFIWVRLPEEPTEDVQQAKTFFQALAMVTDAPSGYSQVITRPTGWAHTFKGALPVLRTSDFTMQFSKRLNRGASEPAAKLSASDRDLLVACYSNLSGTTAPLAIAGHRLLRSEMRSDVELADVILDLCIGIESLLSDSAADMTYKLGMRAAAVLGARGWDQPSSYVDAVKKIYDRRSAVVHGRGKEGKTSTILAAGQHWNAEDLARMILRELMLARQENPSLDPKTIDADLVRPALDSYFAPGGGYTR